MTFIIADRVRETTTTTGTGNIALAGAATGYRAFSSVCANNDTVAYTIAGQSGSEWETGLGTWQTGNTLVRTTVIASSNANAAVSFSAGTKDVFLDVLAAQIPISNRICDGRLTLTSGTPVTTSDVTGATTVYFTPFIGNEIALYTGSMWRVYRFSEISVALGTLANASNYDIFAYDSAGVATLAIGPAWTSDTARGSGAGTTELATQDGVLVNNVSISGGPGAKAGRYLGSFRTTATTTTEDSGGGSTTQVGGRRFLYNHYSRTLRTAIVIDTTDAWSYTTATIRQANGASGNKVEYLSGVADLFIEAAALTCVFIHDSSANGARVAVGIDSTAAFSGLVQGGYNSIPGADVHGGGINVSIFGRYLGYPGLGYHQIYWLEKGGDGICTFLGDNGGDGLQAGLSLVVSM
jgi:hypothetical protein